MATPHSSIPSRWLASTAVLLFVGFGALAPAADEPRDHVVFVGVQTTVRYAGETCPVVGARPGSVDVITRGQRVTLPLNRVSAIDTAAEPKISAIQVELGNVQTQSGYIGSDPDRDRDHQQMMLSILAAEQQTEALNDWRQADSNVRIAEAATRAGTAGPEVVVAATAERTAAAAGFDATVANVQNYSTIDRNVGTPESRYNALNYSAELTCARKVTGAYAMLRAVVRDPANPRATVSTVRFVSLPELGPQPQPVRIPLHGLPAGFSVETCTLSIFLDGRELATSASANRLAVTRAEAHQFLRLRHLGTHPAASLPPQVIPELVPPALAASVSEEQLAVTVDLAIDRDGHVTAVSVPPAATLSAEQIALLREVCFHPALHNGEPAASSGTFALGEFSPR